MNNQQIQFVAFPDGGFVPYIVTVSHDGGLARLRVSATSQEAARAMVVASERCPSHAIVSVRAV